MSDDPSGADVIAGLIFICIGVFFFYLNDLIVPVTVGFFAISIFIVLIGSLAEKIAPPSAHARAGPAYGQTKPFKYPAPKVKNEGPKVKNEAPMSKPGPPRFHIKSEQRR
ncbi:uncharacterized protein EHS24_001880 [Apiotrichum porosum]|uniref:Uncharacterized protein n=1 Tax=Apiotrichum porosum TaxID=105984 RepID=A0A427XJN2_9TREE|nr:uncharacterized protein EHS24_001880 [Apiotrichum porosum]RSH78957.1 hypothetical protein EHS24_001880 [Apiotrichum porosum]